MYTVTFAGPARKGLRKHSRTGRIKREVFGAVVVCLEDNVPLPARYKDHKLTGAMSDLRECHLGFDMLMTYKRNELLHIVTVANIGTHQEIFGK